MAGCETDLYFHLVEGLRIRGTVPPLPHILPMLAQAELHISQVQQFPIFL
jgi:hypothetical protein